jgi:predicted MFS family arabinose efflux permease
LHLIARIRALFRWWVTPRKQPGPDEKLRERPLRAAIGTAIGIVLILSYFYYFQPYNTTDGTLFWLAFVLWATPFALVGWLYRKASPRRANTMVSRLLIAIGAVGIFVSSLSNRTGILSPLVLSGWPAWIAGAIVGSDLALISRLRRSPKTARSPRDDTERV